MPGQYLVTDGQDSILRVWSAADGKLLRRVDPDVGAMGDFALATRSDLVMASSIQFEPGRGFVRRVAVAELETRPVIDSATWNVADIGDRRVALCPDPRLLAPAPSECGVWVPDAWTGVETGRFDVGNRAVDRLDFARNGRRLAVESRAADSVHRDLRLHVVDVERKEIAQVFRSARLPDGRTGVLPGWEHDRGAGGPGIVRLGRGLEVAAALLAGTRWSDQLYRGRPVPGVGGPLGTGRDSRSARMLPLLESADGRTRYRQERPDGLAGPFGMKLRSESSVIRLVDATTGRESRRIKLDGSEVWALAFSPDGKALAATTGWKAGRLRLLDVATGRETRAIESPPLRSPALAFTPEGSRLVSGMADRSVLVWDVRAGR